MKFVKTAKYWLPFIFYMALIFYLSSRPDPRMPMPDVWNIDKIYHSIEYSIFSFLAYHAFAHTPLDILSKNAIVLVIIFTSFYGATDEIHQIFVQGRQANVIDWVFDAAGGFIGIICALFWRKVYRLWIDDRGLQIEKKNKSEIETK